MYRHTPSVQLFFWSAASGGFKGQVEGGAICEAESDKDRARYNAELQAMTAKEARAAAAGEVPAVAQKGKAASSPASKGTQSNAGYEVCGTSGVD